MAGNVIRYMLHSPQLDEAAHAIVVVAINSERRGYYFRNYRRRLQKVVVYYPL
jgi:hypothetical protein